MMKGIFTALLTPFDKNDKIIITGGDTSGTSGNTSLIKIEKI